MSSQNFIAAVAFAALIVAALYAAGPDAVMTGLVVKPELAFASFNFDDVFTYADVQRDYVDASTNVCNSLVDTLPLKTSKLVFSKKYLVDSSGTIFSDISTGANTAPQPPNGQIVCYYKVSLSEAGRQMQRQLSQSDFDTWLSSKSGNPAAAPAQPQAPIVATQPIAAAPPASGQGQSQYSPTSADSVSTDFVKDATLYNLNKFHVNPESPTGADSWASALFAGELKEKSLVASNGVKITSQASTDAASTTFEIKQGTLTVSTKCTEPSPTDPLCQVAPAVLKYLYDESGELKLPDPKCTLDAKEQTESKIVVWCGDKKPATASSGTSPVLTPGTPEAPASPGKVPPKEYTAGPTSGCIGLKAQIVEGVFEGVTAKDAISFHWTSPLFMGSDLDVPTRVTFTLTPLEKKVTAPKKGSTAKPTEEWVQKPGAMVTHFCYGAKEVAELETKHFTPNNKEFKPQPCDYDFSITKLKPAAGTPATPPVKNPQPPKVLLSQLGIVEELGKDKTYLRFSADKVIQNKQGSAFRLKEGDRVRVKIFVRHLYSDEYKQKEHPGSTGVKPPQDGYCGTWETGGISAEYTVKSGVLVKPKPPAPAKPAVVPQRAAVPTGGGSVYSGGGAPSEGGPQGGTRNVASIDACIGKGGICSGNSPGPNYVQSGSCQYGGSIGTIPCWVKKSTPKPPAPKVTCGGKPESACVAPCLWTEVAGRCFAQGGARYYTVCLTTSCGGREESDCRYHSTCCSWTPPSGGYCS